MPLVKADFCGMTTILGDSGTTSPARSGFPAHWQIMKKARSGTWIFPVVCLITLGAAVAAHLGTSPLGPLVFVTVLGGWVISICLHEFAHAVTALTGGDTSVKAAGYLTLNPARYIDSTNSLVIPVILLAIGGIPLPGGAVRVHPGRFRHRWWSSVVAAAGPVTNLILGVVLALLAAPLDSGLGAALSFLALLQFVAGILNLLPVPGFDGYGIIAPYLPARITASLARWGIWAPLAAFAIIFFVPGVMTALFGLGFDLLALAGGNGAMASIGSALFQFWR